MEQISRSGANEPVVDPAPAATAPLHPATASGRVRSLDEARKRRDRRWAAGRADVTVVLPVRNEEAYIGRAIRSLQRQTVGSFDLLVIDDGSTDATADIVARLAAADGRIRLLPNEGDGFVAALQTGLAHAATKLVARMDADDVALRRRFEVQLSELHRNPQVVALGTFGWRINQYGLPIGRLRTGPSGRAGYYRTRALRQPVHLTHPSVIFRRDAFDAVGGYSLDYYPAEDYALWNRLADVGEVYAIPQPLTLVAIRTRGISADTLLDQQLMQLRVDAEVTAGERFDSYGEFTAALRETADWERLLDACQHVIVRRRLARYLINGHFGRALTTALASPRLGEQLRQLLRRAVRG
jgi:hypothetical protein